MGFDDLRPRRARTYDTWGMIGTKHGAEAPACEDLPSYRIGDYCPSCASPSPGRHPATSFEGEVSLCLDDFHLQPTPDNQPAFIATVREAREAKGAARVTTPAAADAGAAT